MRHIKRQLRLCGATSESSWSSPWPPEALLVDRLVSVIRQRHPHIQDPAPGPGVARISPARLHIMILINWGWEIWPLSSAVATKNHIPTEIDTWPDVAPLPNTGNRMCVAAVRGSPPSVAPETRGVSRMIQTPPSSQTGSTSVSQRSRSSTQQPVSWLWRPHAANEMSCHQ